MRRFTFILLTAILLASCTGKVNRDGFAIVIDRQSYKEAKAEIDRYMQVVEGRGLLKV